jgi:hypothetical protein
VPVAEGRLCAPPLRQASPGRERAGLPALRDRYEDEGAAGLLDRRLGKASARGVPADQMQAVLTLYRERYRGEVRGTQYAIDADRRQAGLPALARRRAHRATGR